MKGAAARLAGLALAALALHLALIQPNHPGAMTLQALAVFPLELPVILLVLIALRQGTVAGTLAQAGIVAVLVAMIVLKVADLAMFTAFNRGFNPLFDRHLIGSAWDLSKGAVGAPLVLVAGLAALALLGLVAAALRAATGSWLRIAPGPVWRGAAAAGAGVAALAAAAQIGHATRTWTPPWTPPGSAFTARMAFERVGTWRASVAELADFRAAAATDPFAGEATLFDRLGGRDVLIVFVESYGRASFDNPLYRPTHVPTLRTAERKLEAAGMKSRSGWLASPTSGGQSWLAHGTLASGMTTGDQTTYGAMLASPRRTLWHLAADAGYRTAAIMPAITMDWPEGDLLGFEKILAAADLGYAGQPFNWVTMPDQYTLSAFPDRLGPSDVPLFGQVALVSSHAPWVPVPELIPWEEVGDGRAFDRWALSGDSPEVVWRDRDRVRDQYRMAIDYSLETVMDWAARKGPDGPLIVILGDHQPAGFVSGSDSVDVPVHVIGDAPLVEMIDHWGWTPGLVPDPELPSAPMAWFRDAFVRAFTDASAPEGAT
jgi:hypothetical protein